MSQQLKNLYDQAKAMLDLVKPWSECEFDEEVADDDAVVDLTAEDMHALRVRVAELGRAIARASDFFTPAPPEPELPRSCPVCGRKLHRGEGIIACRHCGWTKTF